MGNVKAFVDDFYRALKALAGLVPNDDGKEDDNKHVRGMLEFCRGGNECGMKIGDVRAAKRALEGLPKDSARVTEINIMVDNRSEEELEIPLSRWHTHEHIIEDSEGKSHLPGLGRVAPCPHCGCLIRIERSGKDFMCDRCRVDRGTSVMGWKSPEREFEERHIKQHLGPAGERKELTAHIPGLGTVNECRVCGCLVAGGPTICKKCAKAELVV